MSVLVDDLKSDQTAVRVASMRRLKEIGILYLWYYYLAGVFGIQRTRDELLPFLYGNLICFIELYY